MKWQPIGTAPKDTQVLAWCSDYFGYGDQGECVIAMLNSKENHWETFHEGTSLNTPTHWMPLPEPTEEKESESANENRAFMDGSQAWVNPEFWVNSQTWVNPEAWVNSETHLVYIDHFEYLEPKKDFGFDRATTSMPEFVLGDRLKEHVTEVLHTTAQEGFALDYALQFIELVDFVQIAGVMLEMEAAA